MERRQQMDCEEERNTYCGVTRQLQHHILLTIGYYINIQS